MRVVLMALALATLGLSSAEAGQTNQERGCEVLNRKYRAETIRLLTAAKRPQVPQLDPKSLPPLLVVVFSPLGIASELHGVVDHQRIASARARAEVALGCAEAQQCPWAQIPDVNFYAPGKQIKRGTPCPAPPIPDP